jgi:CheY-like chemotaxis protein
MTVAVMTRRHTGRTMDRLHVLLLVADDTLRELMVDILDRHRTTACACPAEARALLTEQRYDLVVITNFGIAPWAAVRIIPGRRDYPVLFMTGYLDAGLERECRAKGIAWVQVPASIDEMRRELRIALDDPAL